MAARWMAVFQAADLTNMPLIYTSYNETWHILSINSNNWGNEIRIECFQGKEKKS